MNVLQTLIPSWFSKMATVVLTTGLLASFAGGQTTTDRTVVQVSAAKDGTTFGLLSDQTVVVLLKGQWSVLAEKLTKISVGAYDNVWGINAQNQLLRLTPSGWQAQSGYFKDVAAASDGSAVALDLAGNPSEWYPSKQNLYPLLRPGIAGGFSKVAIGHENRLYALDTAGNVFKFSPPWLRVKGSKYKEIFVSADGMVTAKDYQNVSFSRTDAAVDLEIQQGVVQPETTWIADPTVTTPGLQFTSPVIASKSVGVFVGNGTTTVNPIQSSFITVSTLPTDPTQSSYDASSILIGNTTGITVGGCASLSGAIDLNTKQPTQTITIVKGNSGCITGQFKKVSTGDPTSKSNPSVLPGPYFATASVAAAELAAQEAAAKAATAPCPASKKYYAQSAHSWVQFTLPPGTAGQTITVPQGAYNHYVFPACNRVYWDQLEFSCKNGEWTLPQGKIGADGYCTGWAGASPYYVVGDR